jgi:hypothetical protein
MDLALGEQPFDIEAGGGTTDAGFKRRRLTGRAAHGLTHAGTAVGG